MSQWIVNPLILTGLSTNWGRTPTALSTVFNMDLIYCWGIMYWIMFLSPELVSVHMFPEIIYQAHGHVRQSWSNSNPFTHPGRERACVRAEVVNVTKWVLFTVADYESTNQPNIPNLLSVSITSDQPAPPDRLKSLLLVLCLRHGTVVRRDVPSSATLLNIRSGGWL